MVAQRAGERLAGSVVTRGTGRCIEAGHTRRLPSGGVKASSWGVLAGLRRVTRRSHRPRQAATAITITLTLLLLAACDAGGDGRGTGAVSSSLTGNGWTVTAPPAKVGSTGSPGHC